VETDGFLFIAWNGARFVMMADISDGFCTKFAPTQWHWIRWKSF